MILKCLQAYELGWYLINPLRNSPGFIGIHHVTKQVQIPVNFLTLLCISVHLSLTFPLYFFLVRVRLG